MHASISKFYKISQVKTFNFIISYINEFFYWNLENFCMNNFKLDKLIGKILDYFVEKLYNPKNKLIVIV